MVYYFNYYFRLLFLLYTKARHSIQDVDSIDRALRIITKDIYIKNITFPITTSIQGGVTASPLTWLAQSVERGSNKVRKQ